jgi:hypothetical protein
VPCPTCDHCLNRLFSLADGDDYFHCPRCGTVVARRGSVWVDTYVPRLVERCREFGPVGLTNALRALWWSLGIEESIRLPHDRTEPK